MKHYFKKWTTASDVLKKIYCLSKNLIFEIDPLNSSCSQKLPYPERTLLFQKSPLQMYLLCLKSNCNCCREYVKLTESNCSKIHPLKSQQTLNVDSTLIYVDITSRRRST